MCVDPYSLIELGKPASKPAKPSGRTSPSPTPQPAEPLLTPEEEAIRAQMKER